MKPFAPLIFIGLVYAGYSKLPQTLYIIGNVILLKFSKKDFVPYFIRLTDCLENVHSLPELGEMETRLHHLTKIVSNKR